MNKLSKRNAGISSDDDMIDITTSGTMTEHTLNQRSPINLQGILYNSLFYSKYILNQNVEIIFKLFMIYFN